MCVFRYVQTKQKVQTYYADIFSRHILIKKTCCPAFAPGMNHFMPVFTKEVLTDSCVRAAAGRLNAELQSLLQETAKAQAEAIQSQTSSDTLSLAESLSLISTAAQRINAIHNHRKLQDTLQKQHLACFEVPADGNCGVYTLLCLENLQFGTGSRDPDIVTQHRNFIADAWEEVAKDDQTWQEIYQRLVATFDVRTEREEAMNVPTQESTKTGWTPSQHQEVSFSIEDDMQDFFNLQYSHTKKRTFVSRVTLLHFFN